MKVTLGSDLVHLATPVFVEAQGFITPNGTARTLKSTKTLCRRVVIYGQKDYRVLNTGNIYVGVDGVSGRQPVIIVPGGETEILAPPGCKLDLNKWYVDADVDHDGFILIYDT